MKGRLHVNRILLLLLIALQPTSAQHALFNVALSSLPSAHANKRIIITKTLPPFTSQYLSEIGANVKVIRHDMIDIEGCKALNPARIVISPGPGNPSEAGISMDVIREFAGKIPILGVCLGHQCMYEVFGGVVTFAGEIVHGKTSSITHDNKGVFSGVRNPVQVIRYHSLAGTPPTLPDVLEVTATTDNGIIQGIRHKTLCIEGVQFHPESIMTEDGKIMLRNFLQYTSGTW
jgi:anthranilate synthase/aminodeoxychorismate synthase-like glutamine amidotransferase